MPAYAERNPELGYWHALGMLAREGFIDKPKVSEMPHEQFLFYFEEIIQENKLQKRQQTEMEAKARVATARARRR